MGQEITNLNNDVKDLSATKESLRTTQEKLDKVEKDFERVNTELTNTAAELKEVKSSLDAQVKKFAELNGVFKGLTETYSNNLFADETQRAAFLKRMDDFLKDGSASFDKIADPICQAEKELEVVQKELERSNDRYKSLLDRHEEQMKRFEDLEVPGEKPKDTPKERFKMFSEPKQPDVGKVMNMADYPSAR